MKIGICLVSTGKYGIFLQPLINDIEKYFCVRDKIEIYLFTDRTHDLVYSDRISVINIPTQHKPFPYPTLYRYKYFTAAAHLVTSDYLFYLDVDMGIVDFVDREILPTAEHGGLVATLHPGFYNGGGSWGQNPESRSYTEIRNKYYAGGFQGGSTPEYLAVCKELSDNISDDESRGIIAEWHDETHWNCYLSTRSPKTLTPEYCMVEEQHLREAWQISHFKPKIIALAKDHKSLRE